MKVRVGVYIDAFNLYYGARGTCGAGTGGWRWLDVKQMAASLIDRAYWPEAVIDRVVYCTAPIDAAANPSGAVDQDIYIRALQAHGSVDHVEWGKYIDRVRVAPLATRDGKGKPVLSQAHWPVKVRDAAGGDVPDARFMVSVAMREEKGSDVNVASHLLADVLTQRIEAAIVITNDSDLKLPVQLARSKVPVGTVNPQDTYTAGDLQGKPTDGVGQHFWRRLNAGDFRAHQLPTQVGTRTRPVGW